MTRVLILTLLFLSPAVAHGERPHGFHETPSEVAVVQYYSKSRILKKSARREKFDDQLQEFEVVEPVSDSNRLKPGDFPTPLNLPTQHLLTQWVSVLRTNDSYRHERIGQIVPKQAGWYLTDQEERVGLLSVVGLNEDRSALFHSVIVFRLGADNVVDSILFSKKESIAILEFKFVTNLDDDHDYEIVINDIRYAGQGEIVLDPSGTQQAFAIRYIDGDSWD